MAGKTGEGALVELGRANTGCSSVRSGLRETDCLVRQRVRLSKVVDLIVPMAAVDSGSATAGKTVASREARRLLRCSFRRESNRYTGDQSVDDKRYHRSLKDKPVLIVQTQDRANRDDVADRNQAHGGAYDGNATAYGFSGSFSGIEEQPLCR